MRALEQAGTAVCEPVVRVSVETPMEVIGPVLAALGRLGAPAGAPTPRGDLSVLETVVPAARIEDLRRLLPGLTGGEGVLEFEFAGYEPVTGEPPGRRRTRPNPLNLDEYVAHLAGRRRTGGWRAWRSRNGWSRMNEKMHVDELGVSESIVRRLIDEQFPQWRRMRLRMVAWGTVNAVYRLGEELVVRVPRRMEWTADLEQEVRWLPVLAPRLPVPIPEPVALGAASSDYPGTWAVYRWLKGTPMLEAPHVDETAVAEELAAFVTAMQEIEVPADPPVSNRSAPLGVYDEAMRARGSLDSLPTVSTLRL